MKIDFVRSGGFGGLRLALSLNTANLAAEEATRIVQLVEKASFFELEEERHDQSPARDRFEYRLTIKSRIRGQHTVVLPESAVPEGLRPLLDHLTALAKRRASPDSAGDQEQR